jgi:16S rRNA processing protein RimM
VLVAGVVARPHGLDGSFYVNAPRVGLLELGAAITIGGIAATIVRRAGTDAHPIVRLSSCDDRAAAEALRGKELLASEGDAPALGPDEYRASDLVGARVMDGARELGLVRDMIALPSCECLSVARSAGAGELLVPLVHDAIRSIDLERRVIDVDGAFLGEPQA